ncbi:ribonuclease BN [Microbacterium mangrovi]|uniref:Ribonuclease BN n=1 Tax=Microbacterium mangrovi TaxID=1348253 RepID=A0A0B2A9K1_9MICO|nr:YihY/virulence factor BrkB family protein [Microbacterium mangrovi]KHK98291.1 ribonuclease BN [Microbacterium mangrovi]
MATPTDTSSEPQSPDRADGRRHPDRLRGRTWKYVMRRTIREFGQDQGTDAAAALTYYAVLSLFPALIAVFSLLGVFGQSGNAAGAVLDVLSQVAPAGTVATLRGPIEQFAHAPGAGLALVVGILLALWSASAYVGAFARAMNRIYEVSEGRPFWKLRPVLLLVTVVTVVAMALLALVLILSGGLVDAIGRFLGASAAARIAWNILRWPLMLLVVILLVTVLYRMTPNVKQPRARWITAGSLLAIVVLVAGTLVFALYVANFSNYGRTYGSFAAVIIFLLWLWIANLALLFGAELDAEIERGRELQAGVAAERHLELPVRDSRRSDKAEAKDEKSIEDARSIRVGAAAAD